MDRDDEKEIRRAEIYAINAIMREWNAFRTEQLMREMRAHGGTGTLLGAAARAAAADASDGVAEAGMFESAGRGADVEQEVRVDYSAPLSARVHLGV